MSYMYTVNDHYERIAQNIWDASKNDNLEAFGECINRLKGLKLTATTRSEYAKAALEGVASQGAIRPLPLGSSYEESLANQAFAIADAMLAEEAKPR